MNQRNTILIVDDRPSMQETMAALLCSQGYHLVFSSGGAEALSKALAAPPDLILLDVMMPDIDGFEVCRRLRSNPVLAEVPIILITALDDRDSRLQGIEAGADDFISKPFDRIELRARIRTILRLNRYRRLMTERSKFDWVVDQSDDGYLVIERGGAIRYANVRAGLYLGASTADRLIDETLPAVLAGRYRIEPDIEWGAWLTRTNDELPDPRYLVRPASANAGIFVLQADLLEMDGAPEPCYLLRLRDVTSQLIDQNAVWTFHALVRHKLGTALSHFHGALHLIENLRRALTDEARNTLLSIASQGATQLQSDINDIFVFMDSPDLLRPECGRCPLADLPAIVEETHRSLELSPARISYRAIEDDSQLELALSRPALELVIRELIENAKKFHPRKSPSIDVELARRGDMLHLHVRDDGQPLAPDQLERAWWPYYQAERYFTGQVPGMGLGLPTIATLIWRVGGTCRIYNREAEAGVGIELVIPLAHHHAIVSLPPEQTGR